MAVETVETEKKQKKKKRFRKKKNKPLDINLAMCKYGRSF